MKTTHKDGKREVGQTGGFYPQSHLWGLQPSRLTNWREHVESLPLLLPLGSLKNHPRDPAGARAMVSGPDGTKLGDGRHPNLKPSPRCLPPSSLLFPVPCLSPFDLLIVASLSGGFTWGLPELMSSPGGRAHTLSHWGEAFTPLGPVF